MGSISFLPILYGAVLVCWFLYNYNLRKKEGIGTQYFPDYYLK